MEFRKYLAQSSQAERRRRCAELRRRWQPCLVASRCGRTSREWRAIGRHSRRQGLDDKYPAGDSAEMNLEWDSGRRVLVAPFKIISGLNRITLLAHLEPPNDSVTDWQLGFSGGTIVLAGIDNEPPLIFNRIAIGVRFDTDKRRVLLTQADISNGEIGIAGTGSVDYSAEPRLQLGFAGTPMSASALKRMWPMLVVPEVREWVIDRVERGSLQRIEVGVNSPVRNLSRRGPPIPDDGLNVNIVASGVT